MKGILEFNLPEEKSEFVTAQKGGAYISALSDIDRILFQMTDDHDHPDEELNKLSKTKTGRKIIELLYSRFNDILQHRDVNLYE